MEQIQKYLSDQRAIRVNIDNDNKKIKKFEQEIRNEKDKLENTDTRTAEIHAQLQAAKDEHTEVNRRYEDLKVQIDLETEELKKSLDNVSQARHDTEYQKKKVSSCKSRISEIQRQNGNISLPGQIQNLQRAINTSRKFREKPVGPVSEFVHLREPKWSSILERQFGQALNAFVVTSKADSDVLSDLMKQQKMQAPILIGNSRPINTSGQEPPDNFLTWMRVLRISNDLVRNQLIINQGIEKTLLIESRVEALDVLNQNVRNVRQIFCFTDDQSGKNQGAGLRLNKSRAGNSSTNPIKPWEGTQRMKTDVQQQLK
jgi:chromosome segregation ATPase